MWQLNRFLRLYLHGSVSASHIRIHPSNEIEQDPVFGLLVDIMDIDVSDNTLLIQDEDCPFRIPFPAQHTIPFGNFTVWPEITQQRVGDSAQAFCPSIQTRFRVNTDTQDLGIQSREFSFVSLIRRDLTRSYRCPGQREERDHHILTPEAA